MHSSAITRAAVLLALAPAALAVGSAKVVNNCGFPIYYASVAQNAHAGMQELQGSYSESYTQPNVGVSIKVSPSMNGAVSQFEFTWADGKIFYDLSNIDGQPFANAGMSLVPSMAGDSANPTCQAVDCPAGQGSCSAAYNNPDDVRTTVCSDQSDLVLTMCPGGSGTAPTSSQPSTPASSPEAATPTSSSSGPNYTVRHLTAPTWAARAHPRHISRK